MNFFEHQDVARARTRRLLVLFALGVAGTIAAVYIVVAATRELSLDRAARPGAGFWDPRLFAVVSAATLVVVGAGTGFKMWELSGGGPAVAMQLGGGRVEPNTSDAAERQLLNVVEEMAIASGTPVPAVFVLREESAVNAFAAGHGPDDAVIGVTRGTIERLSRDELQGVIAHEFSHVLNGDMRLNLRLMGIVHGLLVIALLGRFLLRAVAEGSRGSSRRKGGGGQVALALLALGGGLFVVGYVGVLFGRLIKAAVSRQREFLADASAVQFTRNPDGIGGALKKIGGLAAGSRIGAAHAEEASHLFFGNGLKPSLFSALLDTHPPLDARIRRIEPRWDGRFLAPPDVPPLAAGAPAPARRRAAPGGAVAGLASGAGSAVPDALVEQAGIPTPEHVLYGADLLADLPEGLRAAAHEPLGAVALVFALLLDPDEARRREQVRGLGLPEGAPVPREAERLRPLVERAGLAARLPLVDLALPALRRLSPQQYRTFAEKVQALGGGLAEMDLFRYALRRVVLASLRGAAETGPAGARGARWSSLRPLAADAAVALAAVAHAGHADPREARRAYLGSLPRLGLAERAHPLLERDACTLERFDRALDRLGRADAGVKRRVLHALAHCVAHDGRVFVAEAELLRAIAEALDCPIPPLPATAAVPAEG